MHPGIGARENILGAGRAGFNELQGLMNQLVDTITELDGDQMKYSALTYLSELGKGLSRLSWITFTRRGVPPVAFSRRERKVAAEVEIAASDTPVISKSVVTNSSCMASSPVSTSGFHSASTRIARSV